MKEVKNRKVDKTETPQISLPRSPKPPPPNYNPEPPKIKSKDTTRKGNVDKDVNLNKNDLNANPEELMNKQEEYGLNVTTESFSKPSPPKYKPKPPKSKSNSNLPSTDKGKKSKSSAKSKSSKRKNKTVVGSPTDESDAKFSDKPVRGSRATENISIESKKEFDPIYIDPVSFSRLAEKSDTNETDVKMSDSRNPDLTENINQPAKPIEIIPEDTNFGTKWGFLRVVARMSKRSAKQRPQIDIPDNVQKSVEGKPAAQEPIQDIQNSLEKIPSEDVKMDETESQQSQQQISNLPPSQPNKSSKRGFGRSSKSVTETKSCPSTSENGLKSARDTKRPVSEVIDIKGTNEYEIKCNHPHHQINELPDISSSTEIKAKKSQKKIWSFRRVPKPLSEVKSIPLTTENDAVSTSEISRHVSDVIHVDDCKLAPGSSPTGSKRSFIPSNESLGGFSRGKSKLTASFRRGINKISGKRRSQNKVVVSGNITDPVPSHSLSLDIKKSLEPTANVDLSIQEEVTAITETEIEINQTNKKKVRPEVPKRPQGVLELRAASNAMVGIKGMKQRPNVPIRPAGPLFEVEVPEKTPKVKQSSNKTSKRKDISKRDHKDSAIDFRAATKVVMATKKIRPNVPPRPVKEDKKTDFIEPEDTEPVNMNLAGRIPNDDKFIFSLKEGTSDETRRNAAKISKFAWFTAKLRGKQKVRKAEQSIDDESDSPNLQIATESSPPPTEQKLTIASSSIEIDGGKIPKGFGTSLPCTKSKRPGRDGSKESDTNTIYLTKSKIHLSGMPNLIKSKELKGNGTRDRSENDFKQPTKSDSSTKSNGLKLENSLSKDDHDYDANPANERAKESKPMRVPSIHITPTSKRKKKSRVSMELHGERGKLHLTSQPKGRSCSKLRIASLLAREHICFGMSGKNPLRP